MDQTRSAEERSAPYKVFEVNFKQLTTLPHLAPVSGSIDQFQEILQPLNSAIVEMTGRLYTLSTAKPSDGAQGEVDLIAKELQQAAAAGAHSRL